MRLRNLLIIGFLAGIILASCNKNEDETQSDPFKTSYSELSDEENKANLETAGLDMVDNIEELESSEAVEVLESFAKMEKNPFDGNDGTPVSSVINLLGSGEFSVEDIAIDMKSTVEEPNSISDIWNELVGKYVWNNQKDDWDKEDLSDAIVIEFPGMENEETNTAVITVNNFSVQELTEPGFEIDPEIDPELPTSLHVDLKYKGTQLLTYDMSGAYMSDGTPTDLDMTLTIADFSFILDLSHSPYTSLSYTFTFKQSDTKLAEKHFEAKGNWDPENIENNLVEHEEFMYIDYYSGDSIFDYYTEPIIENIVHNGNAYVQVLNIKVAAQVDIEKLAPKIKALDEQYNDIYGEDYYTNMAQAINENALFVVIYVDDNTKIAAAEAYPYYDSEWEEWDLDFRFVFADGSKVDAETYFEEGFDAFFDELESFMQKLENKYSSEDGTTV
jgi:hypothetical protein